MPTVVALDLIQSSMRLIGALESGETATAAEATDALAVLNDLIENWNTENLTVYSTTNQVFSLVAGQAAYTLGPTGNWNGFRPLAIESAYVKFQGIDYPLQLVDDDTYNSISLKTQGSPIPLWVWFNPSFPLASVVLWPVPADNSVTITMTCNLQFSQLANTAASISLPPGYTKAMRYALALELAPEYGITLRPEVIQLAQDAKADVKRINKGPPLLAFDAMLSDRPGSALGNFLGGL